MSLDAILELIASIIASATVISGVVYAMFKKVTKEIRQDQVEIRRLVESNDKINCKIALNSFLNKVNDNGIESIDEEECRLYYDLYKQK